MEKLKVGILGGTFDPIHFGHINLAIELLEKCTLDEVYFCPSVVSPFKINTQPDVKAEHRLEMVKLATQGIKGFKVLDSEIYQEAPVFTIDTIREFKKHHPDKVVFLLLGQDLVKDFHLWKEYEELVRLAPPLIGTRMGYAMDLPPTVSKDVKIAFENGFHPIHHVGISSTYIRQRLMSQLYCGHLVPANVLDYIKTHGLYLGV